jgi:diaminopimelate epimerase
MKLTKAQAYGNDFLLADAREVAGVLDLAGLARAACDRHRGLGADGLVIVEPIDGGAQTSLFNRDGSRAEVSGNGVRCVAAWLASVRGLKAADALVIGTAAGPKDLTLLEIDTARPQTRFRFRAGMGQPEQLRREELEVGDERVSAVILRMGNPQCVVFTDLSEARLHAIGGRLAVHPAFPEGTNVELASVDAPDRVRILIWERGVGPTESSGTGACAAAVASAAYGGAERTVRVTSPGGVQDVEWQDDGVWLSGWANIVATIDWFI